MTVSQENALRSAESYLSYTAFSRSGLIKQLEYEQFSTADAEFAVDNVTVDWMEQAAKSAKNYLDFTSFSRSGSSTSWSTRATPRSRPSMVPTLLVCEQIADLPVLPHRTDRRGDRR